MATGLLIMIFLLLLLDLPP